MNTWNRRRYVAVSVLLALAMTGLTSPALDVPEITGQGAGMRLQYAKLEFGDRDMGFSPVAFGYYDLDMDPWSFVGMMGYGAGFDNGAKRFDTQLSAGRALGPVVLGAAYHIIKVNADNEDWYYHGPELTAAAAYPIAETDFSVSGVATLLPYVFAGYEQAGSSSETSHTWGFSLDAGAHYAFLERWRVSAGYRYLRFQDTDFGNYGSVYGDRYHGPYLEGEFSW